MSAGGPAPRPVGAVHWRGLWTLFRRELIRYLRSLFEDAGGQLVSSLLFLTVFALALPEREMQPGIMPLQFLAPGLVAYALFLSAFQYAAFPLLYDRLEGMIGDIVMAPLTPWEIVAGYVVPAVACGLLTGLVVLLPVSLIVELPMAAPLVSLGFALAGATLFALAGFLTGLWAQKWDRYSVVETFLVLPLGLLSGTFFTLGTLPELGQQIILLNPVFYAIDGFRSGFTGIVSASPWIGLAFIGALVLALWTIAWRLVAAGYRIKA